MRVPFTCTLIHLSTACRALWCRHLHTHSRKHVHRANERTSTPTNATHRETTSHTIAWSFPRVVCMATRGVVIHVVQSKPQVEPIGPFEIVHQRPRKIAPDIHTVFMHSCHDLVAGHPDVKWASGRIRSSSGVERQMPPHATSQALMTHPRTRTHCDKCYDSMR